MKVLLILISLFLFFPFTVYAQQVQNNRLGVHILDPSEISQAAQFVNTGDKKWGYVVVPIRIDDRDLDKWQTFFTQATQLQVIPIIRLAMHADSNGGWAIPTDDEIYYSAKFLNQMPWPIKQRYIIVFNEPNHAPEWGGQINPAGYGERLNFAIDVFKNLNPDFFMLNAALDWAAPNSSQTMKASIYLKTLLEAHPELVTKIDGWNSHAYPNPGFSSSPLSKSDMGISSYKKELEILNSFGLKNIPVFITETNWSHNSLPENTRQAYWTTAWNDIWIEPDIQAITVWLLTAGDGPFTQFSLIKNGQPSELYKTISQLNRASGNPEIAVPRVPVPTTTPKEAGESAQASAWFHFSEINNFFSWMKTVFAASPKHAQPASPQIIFSNGTKLNVEIASTPAQIEFGLMFRTKLEQNSGMIFLLDGHSYPSFWMKNTLIPLDMIWIKDNKIVHIHQSVPVEQDPSNPRNFYKPDSPADQVIEVNAGWSAKNNVKVGDTINLIK